MEIRKIKLWLTPKQMEMFSKALEEEMNRPYNYRKKSPKPVKRRQVKKKK